MQPDEIRALIERVAMGDNLTAKVSFVATQTGCGEATLWRYLANGTTRETTILKSLKEMEKMNSENFNQAMKQYEQAKPQFDEAMRQYERAKPELEQAMAQLEKAKPQLEQAMAQMAKFKNGFNR